MSTDFFERFSAVDVVLIAISLLIAHQASRTLLSVGERVADTRSRARGAWLIGGSVPLGLGVAAMSACAVLATGPGPPIWYSVERALLAAALAITAVLFALSLVAASGPEWRRSAIGGLVIGPALAAMHFTVMSAFGWYGALTVDPRVTAAAFALSSVAALLGLRIVIHYTSEPLGLRSWPRAGSAALFVAALGGGFATAYWTAAAVDSSQLRGFAALLPPPVAMGSASAILLLLAATVLATQLDRRMRLRHRETEALRRSEDRFRSLVQASAQIVWTTAPDGQMVDEQSSWSDFTGQDPNGYRGLGWFNAIHPEDRELTAATLEEALANRRPAEIEHRVRRADGRYRTCLARIVPVVAPDGRVREWIGAHTDVTDSTRMQQERDLLASAGRVLSSSLDERETLNAIASLLVPRVADWCTIDVGNGVPGLQRVAASHTDPSSAEILRTLGSGNGSASGFSVARVLETGESELIRELTDETVHLLAPDDARRKAIRDLGLKSLIRVPLTARGHVLGVLTLALARDPDRYDLRDLALAEELARRSAIAIDNARLYSAANAAIKGRDEVLSIVSHDLRNPLGTIMTTSDLLLDESGSPADLSRYIPIIRRSAARMNGLINDLLDACQSDSGTLAVDAKPSDPAAIVAEACESMRPLAEEKSQRLTHAARNLPFVQADVSRIHQVLSNLIGNAVKFTDTEGRIHVEAKKNREGVIFTVTDTGPGIAAEDLPHLFDRHWRSKGTAHLGAGLGLAISKGIVDAHGGRIWAESELNRGTRIHFLIPTADSARGQGKPGDGPHALPESAAAME